LFAFVGQVVHILAVFPQGHTLVMVAPTITVAHPMRIAHEERPDVLLYTEVDHLTSRFMAQVADTTFAPPALLILGVLELLPPSGILLTTSLFPGNLAKLPVPLSLERTNATPGDNQCLPGIGGDRRKMDLSQVYSGMNIAWNSFCLHNLNAHV
jgi:hypothetical protein